MAVKVIKEHKIQNNGKYKTTCPMCGAEIEYLGIDVSFDDEHPGGSISCPKCDFEIQHSHHNFTGETVDESVINKQENKRMIVGLIILGGALILIAAIVIIALKIAKIF